MRTTVRRKRALKITVVGGALLLWFVGVAIAVSSTGRSNPDAVGDVAIVLGAAVWGDEPSPVLAARIDHAIGLYDRGRVTRIIFTGGKAEGDSLSEGEAARRYALDRGVPGHAIYIETTRRAHAATCRTPRRS